MACCDAPRRRARLVVEHESLPRHLVRASKVAALSDARQELDEGKIQIPCCENRKLGKGTQNIWPLPVALNAECCLGHLKRRGPIMAMRRHHLRGQRRCAVVLHRALRR